MERVKEICDLADGIILSVQEISMELRPSILDDLGLDAALEWRLRSFGETAGVETSFISTVDSDLVDPDLGAALYRIFQEALTNIARHAAAGRVEVELSGKDVELSLTITDDGRGIKESEKSGIGSLGILGMKERANAFGGSVDIGEGENGGTTINVRIPFAGSGESRIGREEIGE
jgi:signal transduction histidine kinase